MKKSKKPDYLTLCSIAAQRYRDRKAAERAAASNGG